MKASIGDVALKAGVSNATVSRTFAHPEQVSEATRLKVQAAADALNFSVSRSAGILKSGRTYRIALLVAAASSNGSPPKSLPDLTMFCVTPGTIWSSTPSRGRRRVTHSSRNFPYAATPMPYSFPHLASAPTRSNVSEPQKFRLSASIPPAKDSMQLSVSTTKKASNSSFDISPSWDIVTCCIYMKAFPPHWDSAHLTAFPDSRSLRCN